MQEAPSHKCAPSPAPPRPSAGPAVVRALGPGRLEPSEPSRAGCLPGFGWLLAHVLWDLGQVLSGVVSALAVTAILSPGTVPGHSSGPALSRTCFLGWTVWARQTWTGAMRDEGCGDGGEHTAPRAASRSAQSQAEAGEVARAEGPAEAKAGRWEGRRGLLGAQWPCGQRLCVPGWPHGFGPGLPFGCGKEGTSPELRRGAGPQGGVGSREPPPYKGEGARDLPALRLGSRKRRRAPAGLGISPGLSRPPPGSCCPQAGPSPLTCLGFWGSHGAQEAGEQLPQPRQERPHSGLRLLGRGWRAAWAARRVGEKGLPSRACGPVGPPAPRPQAPPLQAERRLPRAERSLGGGMGCGLLLVARQRAGWEVGAHEPRP